MDWLIYTVTAVLMVLGIVWYVQHRKQVSVTCWSAGVKTKRAL